MTLHWSEVVDWEAEASCVWELSSFGIEFDARDLTLFRPDCIQGPS